MFGSEHGIGIPGVEIHSQDHICALFNGPARRTEIVVSYLRAGLAQGDQCVVVLEEDDPRAVLESLADPATIEQWETDGRLEVCGPEPAPAGADALTVDGMLTVCEDLFAGAADLAPSEFMRLTGDAHWWDSQADRDTLVRYEAELTAAIPPQVGLMCLYDVSVFNGPELVDAVRAHPRLLVGSVVIENPFFVPPEELEGAGGGAMPDAPSELDIFQLANLGRVDMSRPVTEIDCRCGAMLFAPAFDDEARDEVRSGYAMVNPYPALCAVCPECGTAWMQQADGAVTTRSNRFD